MGRDCGVAPARARRAPRRGSDSCPRGAVDLDRDVNKFLVDGQHPADVVGTRLGTVGDQRDDARVLRAADPPHVQVGDHRRPGRGGHDLADLVDHRRVHLGVQQHAAGVAQQPARPRRHQHRPPSKATIASTEVAASASTCM